MGTMTRRESGCNDMGRILIIDDDVGLCDLLTEYLSSEGFFVESVHDGEEGEARALSDEYSLVILDVMLPRVSGFELLRRLRAGTAVPVLMLTARGDDVDRIVGLEMGADDYLPKPFNSRELVARIRAVLRRSRQEPGGVTGKAPPPKLRVDDVEMDLGTLEVLCREKPIELTAVEFKLLEVLLRHAGLILSREELTGAVLGRTLSPYDRSIDVHISKLRRKLGNKTSGAERIRSVRNSGYIYVLSSSESETNHV
jgi:two-component system response regulator CpxR